MCKNISQQFLLVMNIYELHIYSINNNNFFLLIREALSTIIYWVCIRSCSLCHLLVGTVQELADHLLIAETGMSIM